ncbi:DMT family transporter [Flavihumibacter sp. UBA7668]|uniref:DMT family transporter n=1 Tax=Flavihumibacter sp. UBA7668 TaxID=1946542 RepID=UPI0025C028E5|nr:DMT family transporter [Flavihumibacter sp. UBA7668]
MGTISNKQLHWWGFVLTFAGAVLFSTKAVMVKLAYREVQIDAISLLMLRMLFSVPFFVAVAWWNSRQEGEGAVSMRDWFWVVICGLLGYYASSWFDFIGLQFISAALERLILFLYPSFTAFINYFLFRQKLSKRQGWALLITYLGIGIAYYGELQIDYGKDGFFFGSLMIFICSITYAAYLAGSGKMIPRVGATRFNAYAMLAASGGIFVHYLLEKGIGGFAWTGEKIQFGLLLAIFATVLPSFFLTAGMKRIGSNNAAIISSIGPVSTIAQAYFFLGEPVHGPQIFGTVLVVLGVTMIGWKSPST